MFIAWYQLISLPWQHPRVNHEILLCWSDIGLVRRRRSEAMSR